MRPLISVITINKNNVAGLTRTINSVINQIYKEFEYIVIDGKSTDGSFEILVKYSDSINVWKSEFDTGIFNAMNKGTSLASGKYLLFINSGDTLFSKDTLIQLINEIKQFPSSDLISGDLQVIQNNGIINHFYSPEDVDLKFMINNFLSHPSTLISRDFFNRLGGFDESFKIVGDFAFFYLAIQKARYSKVNLIVSTHFMDGVSNSPLYSINHQRERILAIRKFTPKIFLDLVEDHLTYKKYYKLLDITMDAINNIRRLMWISQKN